MLGPNREPIFVFPEKMVVAEMLEPEMEDAVIAVKTGEPITDTIGR